MWGGEEVSEEARTPKKISALSWRPEVPEYKISEPK